MDSEWLNKVLSSYLENIEQSDFDWQRINSFFEESEDIWTDHAATKFRLHCLDEIGKNALSFMNGLNQQYETLIEARRYIENAEHKNRVLNICFDDFSQACSKEEALVDVTKKSIKETESEIEYARRRMEDVHNILRQIG